MKNTEPWYSAKCIFLHKDISRRQKKPCYEERITLVRARTFKEAIRRGESEAKRYAKSLPQVEYLGFVTVFQLFGSKVGDGTEIYSILRSIRVPKAAFVTRYYDDGTFHARTVAENDHRD
jgi:hypothetical protein